MSTDLPAGESRGRGAIDRGLRIALPVFALALGLAAWELVVRVNDIPTYVLPSPSRVASALVDGWPVLSASLLVTMITTLQGFALAAVGGVGLAILFNQSRLIEYSLYPYAVILQVTPIIAIAPLLLIYLSQPVAVLFCAWIVAFFPVLSNTTLGLRSVDRNLADLFELYQASRWQRLVRLKLPSAMPYILGGLRIAGGLSLIGAVVAEIAAGSAGAGSGLAYRIVEAGYRLNIPRMFAALILLSVAGIAIFFALSLISQPGACAIGTPAQWTLKHNSGRCTECQPHSDAERGHQRDGRNQAAMEPKNDQRGDGGQHRRLPIEARRIDRKPAQRPGLLFGDVVEQHVQREPDREIEDDADHRGGDRRERAGQPPVVAKILNEGRAGENEQERRHERRPQGHRDAEERGRQRIER